MTPISRVVGIIVRYTLRPVNKLADSDEEILLLRKKREEGTMTLNERDMINNALSLDELLVNEIMTPHAVVQVFDGQESRSFSSPETQEHPLCPYPNL